MFLALDCYLPFTRTLPDETESIRIHLKPIATLSEFLTIGINNALSLLTAYKAEKYLKHTGHLLT